MNVLGRRVQAASPVFYGWVIVATAAASNISRVASAVEVSTIFVPVLTAEFGWSLTAMASATTIGSIGGAVTGPLVGWVVDRFGARMVVAAGATIVGGACFVLAGVDSLVVFIVAYAAVRYAGQGLILFSTPVVVANWFERRRGSALAVLFGGSALGLVAAPFGVQLAINAGGWRFAWVVLGGAAFVLGVVPALVFLVRRPEDVGLAADGPVTQAGTSTPGGVSTVSWGAPAALRTPTLWLLGTSTFLVSVVTTGVGFHQMPYYLSLGIDATIGAAVVSTFAAGIVAGSITFGLLADRVSGRWLMVGQNVALAAAMGLLLRVDGVAQAFGFAMVFGVLVGGYMTLPAVLVADYFGRGSLGAISGLVNVVRGLGLALGPTVAGAFFDQSGHYAPAFQTFAMMALVAALLMGLARKPKVPIALRAP